MTNHENDLQKALEAISKDYDLQVDDVAASHGTYVRLPESELFTNPVEMMMVQVKPDSRAYGRLMALQKKQGDAVTPSNMMNTAALAITDFTKNWRSLKSVQTLPIVEGYTPRQIMEAWLASVGGDPSTIVELNGLDGQVEYFAIPYLVHTAKGVTRLFSYPTDPAAVTAVITAFTPTAFYPIIGKATSLETFKKT